MLSGSFAAATGSLALRRRKVAGTPPQVQHVVSGPLLSFPLLGLLLRRVRKADVHVWANSAECSTIELNQCSEFGMTHISSGPLDTGMDIGLRANLYG